MKTRYIWLLPLLLSSILLGCSDDESPVPDDTREERLAAPNFTLLNTELESVSLSDYSGKVVILDFWATWCAPCRAEIPHFVELYDQYQEAGLEVLGISLDSEGLEVVKPFMEELGINYTILLGEPELLNLYSVPVIPTAFVLDRQGRIVQVFNGTQGKERYEALVKQLL